MDGQTGIEANVLALQRILGALVAMAGEGPLPRLLHRAILRLLRPAEAAARRLIVATALAAAAPARERESSGPASPGRGPAGQAQRRCKRHFQPKMPPQPKPRPVLLRLALPLADRPRQAFSRRAARPAGIPRLWAPGMTAPRPAIPAQQAPSGPDDRLDAMRLRLRLDALGRALADLPAQAQRFLRWQARQARRHRQGRPLRVPLRPGRPPGAAPVGSRAAAHEVQAVLAHAHALGWWALNRRPAASSQDVPGAQSETMT